MAVFAKAMANGYPMAAILGTGDVMQAAQGSFISSTFWTEKIGPVAALATIRKHRALDISSHLVKIGKLVQQFWRDAATKHGLSVSVTGIPPLAHFSFDYPNGLAMRTLFTQLMLDAGFLATGAFYAAYAHQESDIARYARTVDDAFGVIANAGEVEKLLKGPVAHAGFYRLS
jgi:glutamate-1-semialdehyde aminotransferase